MDFVVFVVIEFFFLQISCMLSLGVRVTSRCYKLHNKRSRHIIDGTLAPPLFLKHLDALIIRNSRKR